jgi:hypothetical protein
MKSLIATWLPAFVKARRTGKERLGAVVERLAREAGCSADAGPREEASPHQGSPNASSGDGAPGFIRLVRMIRRQHRRLQRAWADTATPALVVAIALRRLRIIAGRSARARLLELARPMPGSGGVAATASLAASQPLLLFEPQLVSGEWGQSDEYGNEGVFIVDYAFLAYAAVATPFRFAVEACRSAHAAARDLPSLRAHGIKPLLAALFLLAAYRSLLGRSRRGLEALFFTSNSFATELLRAYLIDARECARIHEILHGVPTFEFEEYMGELLAAPGGAAKHEFIPQLPGLDLYGAYAAADRHAARAGINAAINRYFFDRPTRRGDLAAWIAAECRAIGIDPSAAAPLIVALPGASTIERDYMGSLAFRVEQAMIARAHAVLEQMGEPYVLVYTPHPAVPLSLFTSHPFFSRLGITIYANTIFTWLIADLTLGLYSTALFEAAYAGAKVFSPMREDDRLYPATLLDRLYHPGADESWVDALNAFLRMHAKRGPESPGARAQRRVAKLIHVTDEDRAATDTSHVHH